MGQNTIPLGIGAYKRTYLNSPEIKLENRYVEKSPSNLQEHVALIGRPGSTALDTFTGGVIRGNYSLPGLFDTDLFVVSSANFWRKRASSGAKQQITGVIYGDGHPYVTWSKGAGYEYLFIADGLLLRYYNGGSLATGTLTVSLTTPPNIASQVVNIDGAYYSWSATPASGTQDGTSSTPWLAKLGANDADSLENLANLIMYAGVPGTDFSTSLDGPNTDYSATSDATHLYITARSSFTAGSSIATTIFSGSDLSWGASTLSGGNSHALTVVEVPDGAASKALASLAGFVLVSIGNTRRVYFIRPGEVTIDPLDFFEKESQPDNVVDMLEVSDHVLIAGNGSSEDWYATGDADAPFAPVKGQAYQRGLVDGTAVVVKGDTADQVILVGNDLRVYAIAGGFKVISDNAMEERIRMQIRREAGLP